MASVLPGRIGIAVLMIGVAAAGWALLRPRPTPVDLAFIDKGIVEASIVEEGETRVRDVFRVSAPIAGKLERVEVHVGDVVEIGQALAHIRPAAPVMRDLRTLREMEARAQAARAGVDLAAAEVAQARAALTFAREDLDRARALARNRTIAARTLSEAQLEADVRAAQLAAAEARLSFQRSELASVEAAMMPPEAFAGPADDSSCCFAVIAPVHGTVLALLSESEDIVAPGRPVVDIGDLRDMEIVVELLSADAIRMHPGTAARIEDWGGPPLDATVRRVDPAGFTRVSALGVEEQRVSLFLDLTGAPGGGERLGHGYRVMVRLVTARKDSALRVPLGALFRNEGGWAVFAASGGTARIQAVTLGLFSDSHAELIDGLEAGDAVILYPSDRIVDGGDIVARAP